MLTSHCGNCGGQKAPSEYSADYCSACDALRLETREYVTRENETRNALNSKIIEQRRMELETGTITAEAAGLKPLIDMSSALRDALLRRAQHTNSSHADPRAPFNPVFSAPTMVNLGQDAKIPPGSFSRETRTEGERKA